MILESKIVSKCPIEAQGYLLWSSLEQIKIALQFVCERPQSPPGSLPNVEQKGEKKTFRDARILAQLMIRKELVQTCTSYSLCSD
jgi:hypothetical protein